ncbi:hypothetical protein M413DRAFT_448719 [Hebeloma cylindrosporum]|uniref:Uncharacterized protein n=1 Tax=Hebeloma cylindrosporum TaxID=76867 RepID=A0A0C2Y894_HEBCY|nr:hypothetical protein M413DRAFT_448719 [Hebeloma cylindrosporum h7]
MPHRAGERFYFTHLWTHSCFIGAKLNQFSCQDTFRYYAIDVIVPSGLTKLLKGGWPREVVKSARLDVMPFRSLIPHLYSLKPSRNCHKSAKDIPQCAM